MIQTKTRSQKDITKNRSKEFYAQMVKKKIYSLKKFFFLTFDKFIHKKKLFFEKLFFSSMEYFYVKLQECNNYNTLPLLYKSLNVIIINKLFNISVRGKIQKQKNKK